jgi:hypothetical protein
MNGFFYSSKFDEYKNLSEYEFGSNVFQVQFNDEFFKNQLHSDAENIKFAWETDFDISKIAESKINDSKNVVVIGYTFPIYNRLIDLNYINSSLVRKVESFEKKITIQDPKAENITSTLLEFFEKPDTYRKLINIKTDCDYFYIPSDIYTERMQQAVFTTF